MRYQEAYGYKTCGNCGHVQKKLGSSKLFGCPKCKTVIPRYLNGAQTINISSFVANCL
ncbi:zinc ribbon domain-containing protein [Dapis sp. BLCC M229]|uniref:zinc ribbon domain-containing protein n=1 Tax=Dapis sp. BLCC M229 TaxID=3400188 RepID=UPI003CFAE0A9